MYDIIYNLIGHTFSDSASAETLILSVCCVVIVLFLCVCLDLIYRLFNNFWKVFK